MVQKYQVSFFKRLADSTGHPVDACQATIEVAAPNKQQAIEAARLWFAECAQIGDWWLRADYETAVPSGTHAAGLASRKGEHRHTARC